VVEHEEDDPYSNHGGSMGTPMSMRPFEVQLAQEVQRFFPGSEVEVKYWGIRDENHLWRVFVGRQYVELTQKEAALVAGAMQHEIKRLFGAIAIAKGTKDGEGKI